MWHERRELSAVSIVARLASELVRWVALAFQSRQSLHAEVLFLRRQLALYVEPGREAAADRCRNAGKLGAAVPAVRMALRTGRRAPADPDSLAPSGFQAPLEMEVPPGAAALQPRPPPHVARPWSARPSGGQTNRDAEVLPSPRGLRLSAEQSGARGAASRVFAVPCLSWAQYLRTTALRRNIWLARPKLGRRRRIAHQHPRQIASQERVP